MSQHTLEAKQKEAKERQAEYSKLSVAEKIAKLDKKLGKGAGAVKERAKLLKKSEAKVAPKQEPRKEMVQDKLPKKKYVKKDEQK